MTTGQARELTHAIRSTTEVLHTLLARAHAGRAWVALGYPTFADYVRFEFGMSRSRAYQILDQARVVSTLESALPGDIVAPAISEAAARDLKAVLDELVGELQNQLATASAAEADRIAAQIIDDFRQRAREASPERGGRGLATPQPRRHSHSNVWVQPATSRSAINLYTSLAALRAMPNPGAVIDAVASDRAGEVEEHLDAAIEWLLEFRRRWSSRHEASSGQRRD